MLHHRLRLLAMTLALVVAALPGRDIRAEFPDIVLRDTFEDPAVGIFPRQSLNPNDYWLGYTGGRYRLWKVNPAYEGAPAVFLAPVLSGSSLAIDAWITGDTRGDYLDLWCRRNVGQNVSGYRLSIFTKLGSYLLTRWDDGVPVTIGSGSMPATLADEWFRVEFQCAGPSLTGLVNGAPFVATEDGTYRQGQAALGAGVATDHGPGTVDAWFDNFVLSQPVGPVGPPRTGP